MALPQFEINARCVSLPFASLGDRSGFASVSLQPYGPSEFIGCNGDISYIRSGLVPTPPKAMFHRLTWPRGDKENHL
jgi:hypothetical protein